LQTKREGAVKTSLALNIAAGGSWLWLMQSRRIYHWTSRATGSTKDVDSAPGTAAHGLQEALAIEIETYAGQTCYTNAA
jgi:hypothetical protein